MPLVPSVKITVPQVPPGFVVRAGLNGELDAGATADLSLVCAPAGYGKTLLLADWSRTTASIDTAWVGLDHDDNEPGRLWASVVAAIAGCPSVPSGSRIHAPWQWRPGDVPEFVAELAEALAALPRPVRLILDDVHELVDPDALHGIRILARIKPATVHLVLASRLDPPLSLPRLRLGGRLQELRAEQLSFTRHEAADLMEKAGLHLTPPQVEALHLRTGGWAAGLRLAALGLEKAPDRDAFLTRFSGDDRAVADYLVGEILSDLPEDMQDFLRVISISNPVPTGLAAELSGLDDAGSMLDRLEHQTSLVALSAQQPGAYTVQELLHTHLVADLTRQGDRRVADLHAVAARWWAGQDRRSALDHAAQSGETTLTRDMLRRFAVPLLLVGDHSTLRRGLSSLGVTATAGDPWLALASSLGHLEAGELQAARDDLDAALLSRPAVEPVELGVLRTVAEQFCAGAPVAPPTATADARHLPVEPELEALARLSRGNERLELRDRTGARDEFEAVLDLSRRHGFDYLHALSLALLGLVAVASGDLRTTRAVCGAALDAAEDHGWGATPLADAAGAMLAYAELMACESASAERVAAHGLATGRHATTPQCRFALQAVHGAAVFDLGDHAGGLAELQRARAEFGATGAAAELCAALAMLEFRVALLLGHPAAAHSALAWLAERAADAGELLMMRAWIESAGHHRDRARNLIRPLLDGSVRTVLPATVVDAWLLETSLALAAGERPAARHALKTALAEAEPLDTIRPFALSEPGVRELLVHQHGSFGACDDLADRALTAGLGRPLQQALLSERELTVLELLPSLLSLDDIAAELAVSVNTVKSHVRSLYAKLGVSSRRLAVVTAHDRGLIRSDGQVPAAALLTGSGARTRA